MWPYSKPSRIVGTPQTPKVRINFDDFARNDKELNAVVSADIWEMIEWLSSHSDTSMVDVIRALLFEGLYGRIAYELLLNHARAKHSWGKLDTSMFQGLAEKYAVEEHETPGIEELSETTEVETDGTDETITINLDEIRMSRARETKVDIEHIGKSDHRRKFSVPHRMWFDLDRQAAKAGIDLAPYVRGLLFRVLNGEVNYEQWQRAREDVSQQLKPPSR